MGTRMPCLDGRVKSLGSLADSALGTLEKANPYKVTEVLDSTQQSNEADAGEETEPKRVATATRSRAQNHRNPGWWDKTEPGETAGLASGSPQAAHDSPRHAGAFPGQSSAPGRTDRGRHLRQRHWNGTRWESVEYHGPVRDDGGPRGRRCFRNRDRQWGHRS